uniref:hypothetical protein n=1 Tax=Nitzschia traheaformis TaxID=1881117 RepID=UPI001EF9D111|nr:hypothetical protein MKU15_pgp118 [Nitzschia traheaformis]ULD15837.1 hypothetical protein [Nitzschia traheaformis]
MQSSSYFSGIVKILESPKQKIINNKIINVKLRVLISQIRRNKFPKTVSLIFWGNLANDVDNYYKVNDYILIEGYVSIEINKKRDSMFFNSKKVKITVLKVYPFLLK